MGDLHHLTWKQQQEMLENAFVRQLLISITLKKQQRKDKQSTVQENLSFLYPLDTDATMVSGCIQKID